MTEHEGHAQVLRASDDEALLQELASGERSVQDVLQEHGLSLRAFSAWCERAQHRVLLERLAAMEDLRSQVLISRLRANIAAQLASIACREERDEVARKACVTLLEMALPTVRRDHEAHCEAAVTQREAHGWEAIINRFARSAAADDEDAVGNAARSTSDDCTSDEDGAHLVDVVQRALEAIGTERR